MKIILSPVASNRTTEVFVDGLNVIVDGEIIDLSVIPDNGYAEPELDSPLIGIVKNNEITIEYHYDSLKAEPHQSVDWADYTFDVTSGKVPCPIQWKLEHKVVEQNNEVQDV